MKGIFALALASGLLLSCTENTKETQTSLIDSDFVEQQIITLASDDFQGREPFTIGEEKTVEHLAKTYKELGLEPVFGDSYFQDVPCVNITYHTNAETLDIPTKKGALTLKSLEDYILGTPHIQETVNINNSEFVFAGYGINAPEYNWNDYENIDVKGKTVLVLVNDPGFATQDNQLFNGNAMTYYGRWAYKYEEAARQGAKGVLVIHETKAAGYSFKVLTNTAGSNIYINKENKNLDRCAVQGWITEAACEKLFAQNNFDFQAEKKKALTKEFKAFGLGSTYSVDFTNDLVFKNTKNVAGMIKGSKQPQENIVYTAHWDHFGHGPADGDDTIYNGAADNATAVGAMLGTAKAFTKKPQPERSVVFLAVTAEERGMIGSKFYAQNNPFPTNKTIANLNYELLLPIGRMKDVTITGFGQSELEEIVKEEAKKQDRYTIAEVSPENGMYYRSDHFSFAKEGIPSLFVKGWQDSREHGKEWAKAQIDDFWATKYHKPDDEYNPETADISGIVEDAALFYNIGERLVNNNIYPNWYKTSEFYAIRNKSLKQ